MDADDPATWPGPLAKLVDELARDSERTGLADYRDLSLYEYEDQMHRLLDGHLVRAWHCTRLLDHEVDAIRSQGLRRLDANLVEGRLSEAHRRGLLTDEQYTALKAKHSLAPGVKNRGRREGQVCLALSTAAFHDEPDGFWRLLAHWGGESLYAYHEQDPDLAGVLRNLGKPAVVTALIDLSDPRAHSVYTALPNLFVGKALGTQPAHAEVFYRFAIPAEHIESIAHPGDDDYDRFPRSGWCDDGQRGKPDGGRHR
ncbi:hypothetical protein [Streptomyces hyaluromycini]|uniref:hypothetical protein n=1 Tax=Streptomyces hyaluromycini TaxID=1377993 RepID=UPI001237E9B6|nr:hypothetical protein [Streptomyces hyaluromycini]